MPQRNLIAGTILTTLGILYGILTIGLPNLSVPGTPGPTLFPWLITTGWLVLSLALLFSGVLGVRNKPKETRKSNISKKSGIAVIGFLAYLILLPFMGFMLSSIFFFAGLMWMYGERHKIKIALTSIVIPIVIFYFFTAGLSIPLPSGPW
jgi:putative tricarboxylic transport membrane protein|tara:strand:- start:553 stop:1002 length:450 start_codon:yes stop_codon:yes gene_type:complete